MERDLFEPIKGGNSFQSVVFNFSQTKTNLTPNLRDMREKVEKLQFCLEHFLLDSEFTGQHAAPFNHGSLAPRFIYISIYMLQFAWDMVLFQIGDTN